MADAPDRTFQERRAELLREFSRERSQFMNRPEIDGIAEASVFDGCEFSTDGGSRRRGRGVLCGQRLF